MTDSRQFAIIISGTVHFDDETQTVDQVRQLVRESYSVDARPGVVVGRERVRLWSSYTSKNADA